MILKKHGTYYVDAKGSLFGPVDPDRDTEDTYPLIQYYINGVIHGTTLIITDNTIDKVFKFKGVFNGLDNYYLEYYLNDKQVSYISIYEFLNKFRDILDKLEIYADEDGDGLDALRKKYNVDKNIRYGRMLVAMRFELDNLEKAKQIYEIRGKEMPDLEDVFVTVIKNLTTIPGEYNFSTYEQVSPDYYHRLLS